MQSVHAWQALFSVLLNSIPHPIISFNSGHTFHDNNAATSFVNSITWLVVIVFFAGLSVAPTMIITMGLVEKSYLNQR